MMRFWTLCIAAGLTASAATGAPVGGRFRERLEQARKQLDPAPRLRRSVRSSQPRVQFRRAPRPGTRTRRKDAEWAFQSRGVGEVSYAVSPRSPEAQGDPTTADLILISEPEGAAVYFYRSGGSQFPGIDTVVVKNEPLPAGGKNLYLLAVAPKLGARAPAFVPLKAGHITTVRFQFAAPHAKNGLSRE